MLWQRGEKIERNFAHQFDTGGKSALRPRHRKRPQEIAGAGGGMQSRPADCGA
jgi:hypothetical protein